MEGLIALGIILAAAIIYTLVAQATYIRELEDKTKGCKEETIWKLYNRETYKNVQLSRKNAELNAFKEAVEHIIENYTIIEANDKIKELVQSYKETDTNSNN